jgi:hypothetical protein
MNLLLQLGWLLNKECRSPSEGPVGEEDWMEVRESGMDYKQRSSGL